MRLSTKKENGMMITWRYKLLDRNCQSVLTVQGWDIFEYCLLITIKLVILSSFLKCTFSFIWPPLSPCMRSFTCESTNMIVIKKRSENDWWWRSYDETTRISALLNITVQCTNQVTLINQVYLLYTPMYFKLIHITYYRHMYMYSYIHLYMYTLVFTCPMYGSSFNILLKSTKQYNKISIS